MTREEFKAQLIESGLNDEQAESILESLDKYKETLVAENATKIEEGIQEVRVDLEKKRLEELDAQKAAAEKKLEEEVKVFEGRLAERVKTLVEAKLEAHGDQIIAILEKNEARKGSEILEEISAYVIEAQKEIADTAADPKEVQDLKQVVENQKKEIADLSEQVTIEKARANVNESDLKELKEAIDQEVKVTIEEDDDAKPDPVVEDAHGTPAGEDHPDSQPVVVEDDAAGGDDKPIPEPMRRMRQLAGIPEKK